MPGSPRGRTPFAVVVASALAVVLAGCSDAAPQAQPPASASATSVPASPSPSKRSTPTPPEMPALANEDSRAGAKAFAAYYIELMNYGSSTGDTRPLKGASINCSGCKEYIDLYSKTYADGGFFKDAGIEQLAVFVRREQGRYTTLMTVKFPRTRFKLSSGKPVRIGRAKEESLTLVVERKANMNVATSLQGSPL